MVNVTKLFCGDDQPADHLRYGHGPGAPRTASERRPIVVWNITRTCNLRCVHCYSDSYAQKYPGELTGEQARAVIDDVARFGVPALLFSGGEPLVRPDLPDLMRYARSKQLRLTLSTNGTLIDEVTARILHEIGLSYVGISLDGIGETNDEFRGVKGAFDAAVRAMRNCRAVGQKVGLRLTLTKRNCVDLHKIFDFIERRLLRDPQNNAQIVDIPADILDKDPWLDLLRHGCPQSLIKIEQHYICKEAGCDQSLGERDS